jgi:hypothetical protein
MTRAIHVISVVPFFGLALACSASPSSSSGDPSEAADTAGTAEAANTSAALVGPCALNQPAFCDSFDAPAGTGNRSGQLNGTVWGVSRAIGGGANFGQLQYNAWGLTQLETCNGTTTVKPEDDVIICNGQLREAVNDLQDVTTLALYPKQPFDFAGRTGVITFDVSNDTLGPHTQWPELWISDQPVPTPFTFDGGWLAAPRHGFGLRFSAATTPYQGANIAAACPNDQYERWSVASGVAVRNYVIDDQDMGGAFRVEMVGCVIRASGPGHFNHVEVRVSASQIDVYATDADTTAPLKHIAVVRNANLSFTRGLVWIEDVHYNAGKFGGQTQHTFSWDNVGFDGPVLARDLAFDAADALVPTPSYPERINLGRDSRMGSGASVSVPNVSGMSRASSALLTFNFYHYTPPKSLTYVVNGRTHSVAWPFPDRQGYTWRTLAVPVPLSEIVAGTNSVNVFAPDQELVVANVDLVLVAAGDTVSP